MVLNLSFEKKWFSFVDKYSPHKYMNKFCLLNKSAEVAKSVSFELSYYLQSIRLIFLVNVILFGELNNKFKHQRMETFLRF